MIWRIWWLVIAAFFGCDAGSILGPRSGEAPEVVGRRGGFRDADTLIVGRSADAQSLDPAVPSDSDSIEVIAQVYDRLFHYRSDTGELVAGLAERWSSSPDGRVWTFALRRDVRFHDGTRLDADAVVFSLERQRDSAHPFHRSDFSYRQHFKSIQAVERVDDFTVRVTIDREYAPFLATMAIFAAAIVSPEAVARWGDAYGEHPVGTGPFKIVSWSRGKRIVLERNDDYWGGAPAFRRLVFEVIADPHQRLIALESGSIDIAHAISPEEMRLVGLHPGLMLRQAMAHNVTYLALNTARPPFADPRVRRAVNLAINKAPIVRVLWQGAAVVAEGPLPPTQWGHHPIREPYAYDPEQARALLAEAAADGSFDPDRTYDLYVTSTARTYLPSPERLGRALRANLADVGVRTRLITLPFAEHKRALQNGLHHLAVHGWSADNEDPDNVLYTLLGCDNTELGHASNVAFFCHPEVHELLIRAQGKASRAERARDYATVQEIVHREAPWVPLAHSQVAVAVRSDIHGIALTADGDAYYKDAWRAQPRSPLLGQPEPEPDDDDDDGDGELDKESNRP